MKAPALAVALLVPMLCWHDRGSAAQAPATQVPTFRASADVVTVDVSVRDRSRVITGLTGDDFVVLDNGVPQQIADVSYGRLPIDVTVVLDVSFSVTGALLDQLRRAVRDLMRDLGPEDRLKLILFNMRIVRVIDFTSDVAAVEAAIGRTMAGGGSSIWDAVAVALVSADAADRRQLVVVFTDTADSTSALTPDALVSVAQRSTAAVASVIPSGLRVVQTSVPGGGVRSSVVSVRTTGGDALRRLAAETGGTQLQVAVRGDLGATFRRVLEDFRSSYVLHYTPRGVERGGFHTIDVSVRDRDGLTVRARRGYFWR